MTDRAELAKREQRPMDAERLAYVEKLNEQEELSRDDVQRLIDEIRRLQATALSAEGGARDDDGDYVGCEMCDNGRVPIEDAIHSEDHYFWGIIYFSPLTLARELSTFFPSERRWT